MKIKGLDGKNYSLNLIDYQILKDDERKKSDLHLEVRHFLKLFFPTNIICEEVYLPGSSGLYLDFLVPSLRIAVEAHGEQHFKFVKHFHGSVKGFLESRKRDEAKSKWCSINDINLVVLTGKDKHEWPRRFY